MKNHAYIHGFEDYKIIRLYTDSCFRYHSDFRIPYCFDNETLSYLIAEKLPVSNMEYVEHFSPIKHVVFDSPVCENHKELLTTAKKVFTHQNCKLSRSLMAEKYKKSLNPWLSDAVIVPRPDFSGFRLKRYALFVNEPDKMIVMVPLSDDIPEEKVKSFTLGEKFSTYAVGYPDDNYHLPYSTSNIMEAEFMYVGNILTVPNNYSFVAELLTGTLPADKIVYENSVQDSLSSESNKLDFDSLTSIMDMLNSSDEDTVAAGLKALSMMDWMHYSQSVKFLLNNTNNKNNWIYNKACNSTSVKYMMSTLAGDMARKRTWWPGDFDHKIYEEDFELFKQLKCHYHHIKPQDVTSHIRIVNFMSVNSEGFCVPNLKQIE